MSAITLLLVLSVAALGSAITPGVTTFTLDYEMKPNGCMVDGVLRQVDETFSVAGSGPCITYKCKGSRVKVVKGSSSCTDGATCKSGDFVSDCSTYNCAVSGQTNKDDEQVTVTQTITVVEEKCNVRGDCYPLNTDIPTSAGTCVCSSSTDIDCKPNLLIDPSRQGALGP